MEFPKKLTRKELEILFKRAGFYPVDIKQQFWTLGHHIKALDSEIKALGAEIDKLTQRRLDEDKEAFIREFREPEPSPKPIVKETMTPTSGEHLAGMFQPSGVTREQIAHTLWKRRHATAKDEQAYKGFATMHRLSDDTMKEMADSWERKKNGPNEL